MTTGYISFWYRAALLYKEEQREACEFIIRKLNKIMMVKYYKEE